MKINLQEAQSQLPELGRLAWAGEVIVITRDGEPYLLLKPYRKHKGKGKRKLGGLEGKIRIAPDFSETPPDIVDSFWNSGIFPDKNE